MWSIVEVIKLVLGIINRLLSEWHDAKIRRRALDEVRLKNAQAKERADAIRQSPRSPDVRSAVDRLRKSMGGSTD